MDSVTDQMAKVTAKNLSASSKNSIVSANAVKRKQAIARAKQLRAILRDIRVDRIFQIPNQMYSIGEIRRGICAIHKQTSNAWAYKLYVGDRVYKIWRTR